MTNQILKTSTYNEFDAIFKTQIIMLNIEFSKLAIQTDPDLYTKILSDIRHPEMNRVGIMKKQKQILMQTIDGLKDTIAQIADQSIAETEQLEARIQKELKNVKN